MEAFFAGSAIVGAEWRFFGWSVSIELSGISSTQQLMALGMTSVFDVPKGSANFAGITRGDPTITCAFPMLLMRLSP